MTLGAIAGALGGVVFGGIAGRLLMLVLRRESPGAVGLTSDDGFEIGEVTLSGSLNLLVFTGLLGAMAGVAYVALRLGLPALARIPLAALLGAALGGTAFINPDGIDLLVLDPLPLAVSGFIVLPALAMTAMAVIVEAVGRRGPRVRRPPAARPLVLAIRTVVTALVLVAIVLNGLSLMDKVDRVL